MKLEVNEIFEHRVFPNPIHLSGGQNKFQAVLPGASSFGSCSCGMVSEDLLYDENTVDGELLA